MLSCQLLPFQQKPEPSLPKPPNLEARLELKFLLPGLSEQHLGDRTDHTWHPCPAKTHIALPPPPSAATLPNPPHGYHTHNLQRVLASKGTS